MAALDADYVPSGRVLEAGCLRAVLLLRTGTVRASTPATAVVHSFSPHRSVGDSLRCLGVGVWAAESESELPRRMLLISVSSPGSVRLAMEVAGGEIVACGRDTAAHLGAAYAASDGHRAARHRKLASTFAETCSVEELAMSDDAAERAALAGVALRDVSRPDFGTRKR